MSKLINMTLLFKLILLILIAIVVISLLILKRKKLSYFIKWGIIGLIIGYLVSLIYILYLFEIDSADLCLAQIDCISGAFLFSFFQFVIYIPVALVITIAGLIYSKLKKRT